ncbi:LysR family transcriptional regulator [Xenorhabdus sp. 18]|uniref:LysR family transcriptional regulator n=1 Tax=Xenorhabdus doucetiae TaxID=351671 RepID=UPI0019A95887|nr:LysR family transcriptional regulator [Xenorhabdus sp. 18]MBD2797268.1 LysR family transcriptional regulator [Xenorhabdus sp. 18]
MNTSLPLKSLKTFLLASKCSSFSQTAKQNHMTKGAISQQIKLLEDWLGLNLFIRKRDGIELNQHGVELMKTCDVAFSMLEEQMATLKYKNSRLTEIKIGCSSSLLSYLFLPKQKQIMVGYSKYNLKYNTKASIQTLINRDIDIYISREDFSESTDLKRVLLFKDEIGLVCTREYFKKNINGVTLFHSLSRKTAWDEWCIESHNKPVVSDEISFDKLSLALDAVKLGLGVTVAPSFVVENEMFKGELFSPYGFVECGSGTYLYYNENTSSDIVKFINELKAKMNVLKSNVDG